MCIYSGADPEGVMGGGEQMGPLDYLGKKSHLTINFIVLYCIKIIIANSS